MSLLKKLSSRVSSGSGSTVNIRFRRFKVVSNYGPIRYFSESFVRRDEATLSNEKSQPFAENIDKIESIANLKASKKVDTLILDTLDNLNFKSLTEVQQKSIIPAIENEKGLVVRAKTGTGKTLAFLLPILNDLMPSRLHDLKIKNKVLHLVIAPTRDLAQQIERELLNFIRGHPELKKTFGPRISLLIGAKRINFNSLFAPSIVIATPGRLLNVMNDPRARRKFQHIKSITYDEADRLLDNGFKDDVNEIVSLLTKGNIESQDGNPTSIKHMFYSATVDGAVTEYAEEYIGDNYTYINCVKDDVTEAHENINQVLINTSSVKDSVIGAVDYAISNLQVDPNFKCLFFLPTIKTVDWYFDIMKKTLHGLLSRNKVFQVHGQMSQSARERSLAHFRRSKGGILICTDVAARGLDFSDITTVIQSCPSTDLANYIHKIGRTGRAGKKGESLLFTSPTEKKYIQKLQRDKKIVFNEVRDYEPPEELSFKFDKDSHLADDAFMSYAIYYYILSDTYGVKFHESLKGILSLFQFIYPNQMLPITSKYLLVMKFFPEDAAKYFDVPSNFYGLRGGQNRGGNRFNNFRNRSGSAFDFKSRGGYSNSRNSYNKSRGTRDRFGGRDYYRNVDESRDFQSENNLRKYLNRYN